jgi:AbrB family looped-hinge helix DNA binding protein
MNTYTTGVELVSTLTRKGQVTIPAPIRRVLGLKPKSKIAFLQKKGGVYITASRYTLDSIRGAVPPLSKRYSEKKIRDIAIESHIEKYKSK